MENILKWNWFNEILVMMGSSEDDSSDNNKPRKVGICGCSNPKIVYEEKKDGWGKVTVIKCKNCGWGSVKTW